MEIFRSSKELACPPQKKYTRQGAVVLLTHTRESKQRTHHLKISVRETEDTGRRAEGECAAFQLTIRCHMRQLHVSSPCPFTGASGKAQNTLSSPEPGGEECCWEGRDPHPLVAGPGQTACWCGFFCFLFLSIMINCFGLPLNKLPSVKEKQAMLNTAIHIAISLYPSGY